MNNDTRAPARIAPYAPEHLPQVCELARHLWSDDARRNAAYLEWKYLRSPYTTEPLLYLAFDGDALVGMRGVSNSRWQIGDATYTLPYADDLVVDPAWRGRWLHQRIMAFAFADLARRGHRHVINLSASRATALGSIKMRWRSCGGVGPVRRRSARKATLDRLGQRMKGLPLLWRWGDPLSSAGLPDEAALFDAMARGEANDLGDGVSVATRPRAADMAGLVRRLPYDGRIRHLRDEAYLGWRYASPICSYLFFHAGGARLDGYLVLQRSLGPGHGRVSIVDWEAGDEETRSKLLAAAIGGGFPELYAWRAACPPEAAQLLDREGFVPATDDYEKTILVRAVDDAELKELLVLGGRRLDDAKEWDLRMIYSMSG